MVLFGSSYSISQPTLEQIFLQLTKSDADEELRAARALELEKEADRIDCCTLITGYIWAILSPFLWGAHQFWLGNWFWGIVVSAHSIFV